MINMRKISFIRLIVYILKYYIIYEYHIYIYIHNFLIVFIASGKEKNNLLFVDI